MLPKKVIPKEIFADGLVPLNNPRNNCGPHISVPISFCLKWGMRTTGDCVLFDFIQTEVTCRKHGISALVPKTLCRGDSFAAQLNATP